MNKALIFKIKTPDKTQQKSKKFKLKNNGIQVARMSHQQQDYIE